MTNKKYSKLVLLLSILVLNLVIFKLVDLPQDKNMRVIYDVIGQYQDTFQVLYSSQGREFSGQAYVEQQYVEGNKVQTLIFEIPKNVEKIRLDLGTHAGNVTLANLRIAYEDIDTYIMSYITKGGNDSNHLGNITENEQGIMIESTGDDPYVVLDISELNIQGQINMYNQAFKIAVCAIITIVILILFKLIKKVENETDLKKYIDTFKRYRYLLEDLVVRDVKVKYRRSVLGLVWSILNPLLMMIVITAVFSTIFKFDIENFPIYYLTGSVIYNFIIEATNGALTSVVGSASLIKKVYIPKYIFTLEKCLFALVNLMFSLIAVIIMLVILKVKVTWTILLFPIPIFYALIFAIGLGLILAASNVFFRDIGHLYSVWTVAWMYLTPIIYPFETLPENMQVLLKWNPLYYFIDYFRQVVMYGTVPNLTTNLICMIFSVIFLIIGLIVFKKSQDKFILYI